MSEIVVLLNERPPEKPDVRAEARVLLSRIETYEAALTLMCQLMHDMSAKFQKSELLIAGQIISSLAVAKRTPGGASGKEK